MYHTPRNDSRASKRPRSKEIDDSRTPSPVSRPRVQSGPRSESVRRVRFADSERDAEMANMDEEPVQAPKHSYGKWEVVPYENVEDLDIGVTCRSVALDTMAKKKHKELKANVRANASGPYKCVFVAEKSRTPRRDWTNSEEPCPECMEAGRDCGYSVEDDDGRVGLRLIRRVRK